MKLTLEEYQAIILSLQVAFCCVLIDLLPALAVAWILARRNFWGKSFLDAVVHLPLVLPPVVVGYLLLILFGQAGIIGKWLPWHIAFSWPAAVIASAVMGFPLMVRSMRLSLELVDQRFEQAAAMLGASPAWQWWTISLPLALPGMVVGAVLCFARSLGEFGATITFAGNLVGKTRTLPLAVYTYSQMPNSDHAAMRLVIVSVLLSLVALLVCEWFSRRVRKMMHVEAGSDKRC